MSLQALPAKKIAVAVIIIFFLSSWLVVSNSQLLLEEIKTKVINQLEEKAGVQLQADRIDLAGINQLIIQQVGLSEPESTDLIHIEKIVVSYSWQDLLLNTLNPVRSIQSLELIQPQVKIVNQQQNNYQSLIEQFTSQEQTVSAKEDLSLTVEIKDGEINYKAQDLTEKISNIQGAVTLGPELEVDLSARLATLADKKLHLTGKIDQDQAYEGRLDFAQVNLAKLGQKFDLGLKEQGVAYQGKLAGKIKFTGDLGAEPDYYGELFLSKAQVSYQDEELTAINSRFTLNNYGLKVKRLLGRFDGAPVMVTGETFGWHKPQLNLKYKAPSLELAKLNQLGPTELQLKGVAKISGKLRGTLQNPNLEAAITLPTGEINQATVTDLSSRIHYQDGAVNLKRLDFDYGAGSFSSDGMVTLGEEFNYILSAQFKKLNLDQLAQETEFNLPVSGLASGESIISGTGFTRDQLNVLGSVSLQQGAVIGYNFDQLETDLWLNQGQLFLNEAQLETGETNVQLEGMVDLAGELDLTLQADQVELADLDSIHHLDKLAGQVSLDGKLTGDWSAPDFAGQFSLSDLVLADFLDDQLQIASASGAINYEDQVVSLERVKVPELESQLAGELDFATSNAQLTVATDGVQIDKFLTSLGLHLPITGVATGQAQIKKVLTDPVVTGQATVAEGQAFDQNFDQAQLEFTSRKGEFIINNLQANYQDSTAQASGNIKEGQVDLDFSSQNFALQDSDHLAQLAQLQGQTQLEGRLYGQLPDLKATGRVEGTDIQLNEQQIGHLTAKLHYADAQLAVSEGQVDYQDNSYSIDGGLDLYQQEFTDLKINIKQGNLAYFSQLLPVPIKQNYQLTGRVKLNDSFRQPRFGLDLTVADRDQSGQVQLLGDYQFEQGVNLEVISTDFDLANLNQWDLVPYQVAGDLDLTGQLTGQLDQLDFDSQLQVTDGQIEGLKYDQMTGQAKVIDGQRLVLNQQLQIQGSNTLQAKGLIPLVPEEEFDLAMKLEGGNLSLLSFWLDDLQAALGQGQAELRLDGTWQDPQLTGEAQLVSGGFAHSSLDRKINQLDGKLIFEEGQVLVKDVAGRYGGGEFQLGGSISLAGLVPSQFDLDFTGQDIAFEHGSWQGLNDGQLEIIGPVTEPLIQGTITAHDLQFALPFQWPTDNSGKQPLVKPRFDLEITPGEKVKVGNDNINILVRSGNLQLQTVNEQLELTGRLKSTTGRFTYYNTEFELQEGRAVFDKYSYIPNLEVQAETNIQGTTIDLGLTGAADQLNFSLSSDPPLTRQEIIDLLTSQGGIGNLLEKNYEEAVKDELWRIIGQGFKTELLYKVERSFEESFNLDQVRIKSLLSNELEIEVGKFIFPNFMLKYQQNFGTKEERSLGFEYNFGQGLDNLRFQGSYNSQGDYNLGVEARIPF
ncbi:translocation/assembly module TamB domain-containing protein [Halanaerobaculum tunisiense]